jgi:hypothetical protein
MHRPETSAQYEERFEALFAPLERSDVVLWCFDRDLKGSGR